MLRSPGPTPALHLRRGGQSRDGEGKRTGLLCPCGVDGPQQGRRHREGVRSLGATPTAGRTPIHRPERPGPAGLAPASSGSCGFAPCSAPGPGGPGGGSAAALTSPRAPSPALSWLFPASLMTILNTVQPLPTPTLLNQGRLGSGDKMNPRNEQSALGPAAGKAQSRPRWRGRVRPGLGHTGRGGKLSLSSSGWRRGPLCPQSLAVDVGASARSVHTRDPERHRAGAIGRTRRGRARACGPFARAARAPRTAETRTQR